MFDSFKRIFSWMVTWISMNIFAPAMDFYQNYPVVEGDSDICAYLRKQNASLLSKNITFTISFSVTLFEKFIESFLRTGSIIECIKDEFFKFTHAFIKTATLLYSIQFKSQIKSNTCSHNVEVQKSIRKSLQICTISRIISNLIMSYDCIYGDPERGASVCFGWIMGFIDSLITGLWFIDAPYVKILVLFGYNMFYCILSRTVHSEFEREIIPKIFVPCILLSILTISYDMSVKSNFILRRQVKEQKIVYEKFLERIKDPVVICDNKNLIFSNTSAKSSLKLTDDSFLEKLNKFKSKSMKPLSEELREKLTGNICSLNAVSETKYYLYPNQHTTDSTRPKKVYMVTIVESDFFSRCKTVSLIIRDITLELEQEEKRFEDRLRNMMLYSLAHELRTPLNFLQDVLYLAKSTEIVKENRDRYENGKGAWNYLRNKINDTLTYAQILSGEFTIHDSDFSFNRFIKQFHKMAKFLIHDKRNKVMLNFKISNENNITDLKGDRERLEQILFNIMQYSIRSTEKGMIEISSHIIKNRIIFEIKDTGCGMSDKNITEILKVSSKNGLFNILQTPNNLGSKTVTNTLGLSTSNLICNKMGGKLEIESKVGFGTLFRLILPYKSSAIISRSIIYEHQKSGSDCSKIDNESPHASQICAEEDVKINVPFFLSHQHIQDAKVFPLQKTRQPFPVLIVDDNEFNRVVVRKMISKYTDHIEEAENGEDAIQKYTNMAKNEPRVLIFMDLDMPIMGGVEATRKIKELKFMKRPFITALTSFASEMERKACAEVKTDWFLSKPLTKNNLEEVIAKFNIND